MVTTRSVALLLLLLLEVQSSGFMSYNCGECFYYGGRQCLLRNEVIKGTCCDPNKPSYQQTYFCKT